MEKNKHIIQLREVTYFPVGGQEAPQQPRLRYWQEGEEQEPWADRFWRRYAKPLLWNGFWFFFGLAFIFFGAAFLLGGGPK